VLPKSKVKNFLGAVLIGGGRRLKEGGVYWRKYGMSLL